METKEIDYLRMKFPGITLERRDAHKLRGYFGEVFKEHSSLLHNHYESGSLRFGYPLVQYKVIDRTPYLIGIGEGAELLFNLFLKIRELKLDDRTYEIKNKNIERMFVETGANDEPFNYKFVTPWMGLNQKNYLTYCTTYTKAGKTAMLKKILTGNVLSFLKNIDLHIETRLDTTVVLSEKETKFKNNRMKVFEGEFIINALLPDYIGLGKSASRGFGSIKKISGNYAISS